jgi:hypothetical protein
MVKKYFNSTFTLNFVIKSKLTPQGDERVFKLMNAKFDRSHL